MKKLFTFLLFMTVASLSFGQRVCDISVQSIDSPATEIQSVGGQTPISLNIAIYNDGPDDLKMGDSIRYLMMLMVGQNIVLQTTNANQGGTVFGGILHRDVTPGDTFHFVTTLTGNIYANYTFEVTLRYAILMMNRPDMDPEPTATQANNIKEKDILWYNEDRFPLNTANVVNDGMKLYPVPAVSVVNIAAPVAEQGASTTFRVFDMQGREVAVQPAVDFNGQAVINVADLENGVYVVQVQSGSLNYSTKFVVQH